MRWAGQVAWMREREREEREREREGVHVGVWFGNLSERGHLERRRRWEDNIKINHLEEHGRGSG